MRLAGLAGESGGNGQDRCARFRERAIERGKAQIVANRDAETRPGQVGHDREVAGAEIARLAIALTVAEEIGRASCRERGCQYVSIAVVAGPLKKKKNTKK